MYVMSADKVVAEWNGNDLSIMDNNLIPLYLKRTGDFEKWVSDRAIDATRPNSRILKKAHGLSRLASDYETAMLYNAACITDNFWVKKGDESWADIKFNSDIYYKAAISSDSNAIDLEPSRTPELTNIGSREKGWHLIDGKWWLYKNESEQNARFEYLTSLIGRSLGFDIAFYEMSEGFIRTKDVTDGILNMQHMDALVYDHDGITEEDMSYNYETLNNIDPGLARQYLDIKYLDVLVNNVDRHVKNYALLTSQQTGEIIRLAPNYDNDMAFYDFPDILHKDRLRGEMREFLALVKEVEYIPPALDVSKLNDILKDIDEKDALIQYLLSGERLVFEAV